MPSDAAAADSKAHESQPPPPLISASYLQLVQHLIERCLLFYMDRDECMNALSKHAEVKPVVTMTVWKELEKSNPEFFMRYESHCVNIRRARSSSTDSSSLVSSSSRQAANRRAPDFHG